MQSKNSPWKLKFKKFEASILEWDKDHGTFICDLAYKKFKRGQISEESYRNDVILNFFMPFHSEVLKSVHSDFFKKFFTLIYTGVNETLLEKISAKLFEYHIANNGQDAEPYIDLTKTDLVRLGTNSHQIFALLSDLNKLLENLLSLSIVPIKRNNKTLYFKLLFYIPETNCSIESMVKLKSA